MSDGVSLLGGHAIGNIPHGSTYALTFSAFSRFSPSVNAFKMKIYTKYTIPTFHSKPGTQKKLKFEIDHSIYKPAVQCATFLTEERIHFWIKTLHDHYFELLKKRHNYEIGWINHLNHDESASRSGIILMTWRTRNNSL